LEGVCLIATELQHTFLQKKPGIKDAVDHIGRSRLLLCFRFRDAFDFPIL